MAISYSTWTDLSLSTRMKIAEALGIPKLRSTHVSDNRVVDDGYNLKDVEEAIKVIPMQKYLNSTETDVFILFKNLVDTVEGKPVVLDIPKGTALVDAVEEEEKPIKKKGRPFKNK